jgi:hypothetical protein
MRIFKMIFAISLRLLVCAMLTELTLCAQQTRQGDMDVAKDGATKELSGLPSSEPSEGQLRNICSINGMHDRLVETAYRDACRTLLDDNPCSKFFGGAGVAIKALNDLIQHIEKSALENRHLGMRMSGRYNLVFNKASGHTYRLFEREVLNLNGPFYSEKIFPSQPRVPNIGQFKPNSREARVTILLHELGHMVRGGDDNWLLPDDAKDINLSSENTALIIKRCQNQIKSLP